MKWIVQAGLIACVVGQVHAQPAESGADSDTTVQQQRLDMLRLNAAQQAYEDERVCHERFAVNDCLKAARVRSLEKSADIRRQQERLNDLQRRQRGEEKIRQQAEKAAQHAQDLRDAAARSDLRAEPSHDGRSGDQRHAVRGTDGGGPPARAVDKTTAHSQPTESVNRQAYQRKLQEAEERRRERDKRLTEKASAKPPAPLPAAP